MSPIRAGSARLSVAAVELTEQASALAMAIDSGGRELDPSQVDLAVNVVEKVRERTSIAGGHTVVALAGATGSGKSSLFNAITGTEWATTGIRRPTTSAPLAAVYGDGAEQLLDWLEIPNRQRHDAGELAGLVLLDLPDHDSKVTAHRAEVDRLVKVVDVFCWVVDPQKYADAALHEGYLRQFGGQGAVLHGHGVDVRVIPVSAVTGDGLDALRRELAARVAERRAIVTRIDADIDWLATDLTSSLAGLADRVVSEESRRQVIVAAAEAAGGAQIEAAVAASYRHRGALAVGWPVLRWIRKAKPDPLARLGLGTRRRPDGADGTVETAGLRDGVAVRRTAITANPLAVARLDEALRHLSQDVGHGLPETARLRLESVITDTRDDLPDALDEAAGLSDLHLDPPRWWRCLLYTSPSPRD